VRADKGYFEKKGQKQLFCILREKIKRSGKRKGRGSKVRGAVT
jgi:hypothetical protein